MPPSVNRNLVHHSIHSTRHPRAYYLILVPIFPSAFYTFIGTPGSFEVRSGKVNQVSIEPILHFTTTKMNLNRQESPNGLTAVQKRMDYLSHLPTFLHNLCSVPLRGATPQVTHPPMSGISRVDLGKTLVVQEQFHLRASGKTLP